MVALAVYLVAAVVLVGLIFFLTRSRRRAAAAGQESPHREAEPVEAGRVPQSRPLEPEEHRPGGRPRRRRDLGSRLQAQRRAQRAAWAEADENEEEGAIAAQEEEGVEKPVEAHVSGKIGAKKLRKLEEKQARKAQREAEEAEREERKRLESQREAEWKKEEERLRLEEEQKEEEERKAREEQAQREHEEYLKLKESFVVEEEGVGETMTEEQSHSFLTEFINYIKQSKVVLLEDLASQVGLRTQDTINRIQDLLAEGTLTDPRVPRLASAEPMARRPRPEELAQEKNRARGAQLRPFPSQERLPPLAKDAGFREGAVPLDLLAETPGAEPKSLVGA